MANRTARRPFVAEGGVVRTLAAHASALGIAGAPAAMVAATDAAFLGLGSRLQGAVDVVHPQRVATVAKPQEPGVEPRQMLGDVTQIAAQDLARLIIEGGIHDLRACR